MLQNYGSSRPPEEEWFQIVLYISQNKPIDIKLSQL